MEPELAHAGRVDEQAADEGDQLAAGRRVAAARVVLADLADEEALLAEVESYGGKVHYESRGAESAWGQAIYIRDPHRTLVEEQLNGGVYRPLSSADWRLLLPYLEENERLFGIRKGETLPHIGDLVFTSDEPEFTTGKLVDLHTTSRTFSMYYPDTRPGSDRYTVVVSLNARYQDWVALAEADYDREKLQERLAKLVGGVAVIKVGAATETEMKEKKARVEDAMNATRAAVEEGIVAGGGVALLRAEKGLDKVKATGDEKIGVDIVLHALEAPIRQIADNAGVDGSVICEKVSEKKAKSRAKAKAQAIAGETNARLAAETDATDKPQGDVVVVQKFLDMILGSPYGKDERVRDFCIWRTEAKKKLALGLALATKTTAMRNTSERLGSAR